MTRFTVTLAVLIALAAWAGAQTSPTAPLAAEQLNLFQSNRELLENLVEHSIDLANADTPVARVKACHESARDLGRALRDAADRDDPDRVAELGDHLAAVLRHGLVPTLDDARRTVPVGTPAERELLDLAQAATDDTRRYTLAIPALGKVGNSPKVQDVRAKLQAAGESLLPLLGSR